jgi:hypothetical protein
MDAQTASPHVHGRSPCGSGIAVCDGRWSAGARLGVRQHPARPEPRRSLHRLRRVLFDPLWDGSQRISFARDARLVGFGHVFAGRLCRGTLHRTPWTECLRGAVAFSVGGCRRDSPSVPASARHHRAADRSARGCVSRSLSLAHHGFALGARFQSSALRVSGRRRPPGAVAQTARLSIAGGCRVCPRAL